MDDMKRQLAIYFVGLGLEYLISIGRIKASDVNHKWNVFIEERSLEEAGYAAGTGLDPRGSAYICFHKSLSIEGLKMAAAHEVVHLAQICLGEMRPIGEKTIWMGEMHGNLAANHPLYKAQPWEAEAFSLEIPILNFMNERLNSTEKDSIRQSSQ